MGRRIRKSLPYQLGLSLKFIKPGSHIKKTGSPPVDLGASCKLEVRGIAGGGSVVWGVSFRGQGKSLCFSENYIHKITPSEDKLKKCEINMIIYIYVNFTLIFFNLSSLG